MDLAWFIYTLAIMLVAMLACSMSMTVWAITGRRDCLYSAGFFAVYLFLEAIILFDEYVKVKAAASVYITESGLLHPWIEVPLAVALVAAAWAWCLERLHVSGWHRRLLVGLAAFAALEVAFCPTGTHVGRLVSLAYWCTRDVALIAALVFGFVYERRHASEAERLGLVKERRFYTAVLSLLVLMLVEDVVCILFLVADTSSPLLANFYWHLAGRNLSENVVAAVLAVRTIMYGRDVLRVYARHPAEDKAVLDDERVAHDFETRLLRYGDAHGLSVREREVMELAVRGKDTQGIATELYISPGTVKAHLHRIYTKTGVAGRQELVSAFWKS